MATMIPDWVSIVEWPSATDMPAMSWVMHWRQKQPLSFVVDEAGAKMHDSTYGHLFTHTTKVKIAGLGEFIGEGRGRKKSTARTDAAVNVKIHILKGVRTQRELLSSDSHADVLSSEGPCLAVLTSVMQELEPTGRHAWRVFYYRVNDWVSAIQSKLNKMEETFERAQHDVARLTAERDALHVPTDPAVLSSDTTTDCATALSGATTALNDMTKKQQKQWDASRRELAVLDHSLDAMKEGHKEVFIAVDFEAVDGDASIDGLTEMGIAILSSEDALCLNATAAMTCKNFVVTKKNIVDGDAFEFGASSEISRDQLGPTLNATIRGVVSSGATPVLLFWDENFENKVMRSLDIDMLSVKKIDVQRIDAVRVQQYNGRGLERVKGYYNLPAAASHCAGNDAMHLLCIMHSLFLRRAVYRDKF